MSDRGTAMEAAAELMATNPGAGERTLEQHECRPDGRCTGCCDPLVRWPCTMVAIARRAVAIHGGVRTRPATGPAVR
jgi:hypothetical protein